MPTVAPVQEPLLLSVVIPVYNEADNVLPLLAEIRAALAATGDYEVIFVDDCSDDETAGRLAPELKIWRLPIPDRQYVSCVMPAARVRAPRSGRAYARRAGSGSRRSTATGRTIRPISRTCSNRAIAQGGPELVGGLRRKRRDVWSKRVATKIANGLRQKVLNDGCMDTGCGIKVFRRDAFLALPFFGAMHRFLPALFQIHGYRVDYVEVNHRPRRRGVSKYGNLGRAAIGVVDLLGVLWLKRRTSLPAAIIEDGVEQAH